MAWVWLFLFAGYTQDREFWIYHLANNSHVLV